jgi:hypothetical protein
MNPGSRPGPFGIPGLPWRRYGRATGLHASFSLMYDRLLMLEHLGWFSARVP